MFVLRTRYANALLSRLSRLYCMLKRGLDTNKVSYSPDVDALLIELSDKAIADAEDDGQTILHFAEDGELVLVEILDLQQLISETRSQSTITVQ